jgi:hypothetical protein
MADRILMYMWNTPVRGIESHSIKVFNEALAILGRRQEAGRIEGFDAALMDPHHELNGIVVIRGTREQIAALHSDDEFRNKLFEASLCVDGLRHLEGSYNAGATADMALYERAVSATPRRA